MFSLQSNASKIAFSALCKQLKQWGYELIDCQVKNPHLISLGASTIDRSQFLEKLTLFINTAQPNHEWIFDNKLLQ
jgi:leucyl/phenylalanyl-tRNA--protein transferase